MQKPITGGCLCGAIRYESSEPLALGYCHCVSCQKAYGGLSIPMVRINRAEFRITKGQPSSYRSSELTQRSFCQQCGSPISFAYDGQATIFVLAGTMDNLDDWPPDPQASWGHAFMSDKVSWHEINDGLPQHRESAGFFNKAKTDSTSS